jgi:regulator of RNase E activity RraA
MRLTDVGTPVTVAGMTVTTGDIVHGDEHGVLHIPARALPEIVAAVKAIHAEEQQIVGWSRSASFTVAGLLELRRGAGPA